MDCLAPAEALAMLAVWDVSLGISDAFEKSNRSQVLQEL